MVTKEQMNEVLRQLAAIYPAWKQAIKTREDADNLKRVWWDEFNRLGMTTDDLQRGILVARKSDSAFLPSLGQFVGWCGSGVGITKHRAWQMAAMSASQKITDPLVYEAVRRTGRYDVQNGDERTIRPLFFEHYEQVCRESAEGEQFALPAPEPERYPEQKNIDPEDGRKTLDGLYAMLDESIGGEHDAER